MASFAHFSSNLFSKTSRIAARQMFVAEDVFTGRSLKYSLSYASLFRTAKTFKKNNVICNNYLSPSRMIHSGAPTLSNLILEPKQFAEKIAGLDTHSSIPEESIKIVQETIPMVTEKVAEITEVFYPRMFDHNNEMLFYFNEANQRNHMQHQAIARAVLTWAHHLREPEKFTGLLNVISHRHVALFVTQDLYSIIYENFMHSMTQVLGEEFTPDMISAWSDAFIWLCKLCIESEAKLAYSYEKRQGGWAGQRKFELVNKRKVAETTIQFDFAPADVLPWHQNAEDSGIYFDPGQYLTIRLPGTGLSPRHYTITSRPGDNILQCTTRLVPGGAVSAYMHEEFQIGDRCLLTVPCGLFTPFPKRDLVMISAGIGITTMYAFLNAVERKYIKGILHFDQSADRMAFREVFQKSGLDTKIVYTGEDQFAEQQQIEHDANRLAIKAGVDADYYVCGPLPFMEIVKHSLQKSGVKNVFCNQFGTGTEPMCPFRR